MKKILVTRKLLKESEDKALKMFEAKLNSNDELYNQSMIGSLRFTMIVSNNLGEIHRAAGNTEKHTMCLQHLLSAMMYMVDSDLLVLESSSMNGFYSNVAPIMGLKKKGVFAQAA